MNTLFLLRSYGDFVVALSFFSDDKPIRKTQLIASLHLKPLYDDLCTMGITHEIPFLHFEDFGIRHQIMGCFTNRYFFRLNTLIELRRLGKFVKQLPGSDKPIYFEQSNGILWPRLFTGVVQAGYIHNGITNVYNAYALFTETEPGKGILHHVDFKKEMRPSRILITPGSRKFQKALPVSLVDSIVSYLESEGHTVCLAGLPSEIEKYNKPHTEYSNFRELIQLVKNSDFVISADSLPVHLTQLIGKPHWILYNKQTNNAWLTPFAKASHFHSTFEGWEVIKKNVSLVKHR